MGIEDAFENFLNDDTYGNADKELIELSEKYYEMFHKTIPHEQFPPSITNDQLKQAIRECITGGKDRLAEILNLKFDDNVLY